MLAVTFLLNAVPAATAETRTLKIYFLHTRERAEIAYKRNGRYLKSGLEQANHILRDWRRDEETEMDPRLLDLLWEVYRASGSNDYIHVVSGYRSPQTNAMLRARSNGVAKKSQHMLGKAIDFYLPDVNLKTVRNLGLKLEAGGVGYYPRSGSPFIHLDVARVRHWPGISRQELVALFPNGKTMHVPSDGKPLPGYEQAVAAYEARQRNGGAIQVADDSSGNGGRGILAALFNRGGGEKADNSNVQVAASQPAAQPARQERQQQVATPAPGTVLASLPAGALPVPSAAPRTDPAAQASPSVDVAAETEDEAVTDLMMASNMPLPSRRPDLPPTEENIQVAELANEEDGQGLPTTAYVTPTPRPRPQADMIAELLMAQEEEAARRGEVQPVTLAASSREDEAEANRIVAALAQSKSGPEKVAEDTSAKADPVSNPTRIALLKETGGITAARFASGDVKTTEKDARPSLRDVAPRPGSMVLPVSVEMAERVLSRKSMLESAPHPRRPAFKGEVTQAPKAVYMTGFEKDVATTNVRSFSGDAVTFLAVAKFD